MSVFSKITAAILAGGFGSRLQSAVADRPKALAEVAGRPFLAWQLDWLASVGVRRAVICSGYLGDMVEQCFGKSHGNVALVYSRESEPLGTGGALRAALGSIDSGTTLVLNGDSLCDADLIDFANYHAFC